MRENLENSLLEAEESEILPKESEQNVEQEEKITEVVEKEKGLFSKFGDRLIDLGRKFREKPKKLSKAVALVLLLRAGTVFAEANMKKPELKDVSERQRVEEKLDARPQFDWKKFIKEVEISYKIENNQEDEFEPEVIEYSSHVTIYGDERVNPLLKGRGFFYDACLESDSAEAFFNKLSQDKSKLTDNDKLYFLQKAGKEIGKTYNYDMLDDDEYVAVSDEKMFQGMRKEYLSGVEGEQTGMCGNIHTFLAKTARNIGIEAWTQSGGTEDSGHIFTGMVIEQDHEKQIVFLDYGEIIPTGTLNYQKALGIAEKYHKNVRLFNNTVSNPDGMPMFVKSLAVEKAEEAMKIQETAERFGEFMENGNFETRDGLKMEFGRDTKKVEFSKNAIGISYCDYKNTGNSYNSLESLQSVRAGYESENKRLGANLSILHLNVNDINSDVLSQNEIVLEAFKNYAKNIKLDKGEYEKWRLQVGATLDSVLNYSLEKGIMNIEKADAGMGAKLIYMNPSETGKFWIGVEETAGLAYNDMQNQDLIVQRMAENFKLGGKIEVREGTVINLDTVYGKTPWGEKKNVRAGIETDKWKLNAAVEKQDSKNERYFPDKMKVSAEIGYKTPIGEFDIYGALEKEEYKDVSSEKNWDIGLKYRMILWK
ncbi:hypothetical protein D4R87_00975 [bacterium]|nr:MAG: hypothetical protein D4R87_00975 [bacterium]